MADGRRLSVQVPVRWEDLDAYEHVNNVAMLRILEEARITAFWRHPGATPEELVPTAVLDSGPEAALHTVVARLEVEYLRPLTYTRVPVDVQVWLGSIGRASIDVCYEIFDGPASGSLMREDPVDTVTRAPVSSGLSSNESSSAHLGRSKPYVRASSTIVVVDAQSGSPRRLGEVERQAWEPYLGVPPVYRHR